MNYKLPTTDLKPRTTNQILPTIYPKLQIINSPPSTINSLPRMDNVDGGLQPQKEHGYPSIVQNY